MRHAVTLVYYNRLLSKTRVWCAKQETICKQPGLIEINEDFEKFFDESSGTKILQAF